MPIITTTTTESSASGTITTTTTTVATRDNATPVAKVKAAEPAAPAPVPVPAERAQLEMTQRMTDVMLTFPAVATYTIMKNTTASTANELKAGFAKLLANNIWLGGKLVIGRNGRVVVEAGHFTVDDLFALVQGPDDYTLPAALADKVSSMQAMKALTAQFDIGTGGVQLEAGNPVCRLNVVTLPGSMLMVEFAVSHQLADGASYYTLSDHISQYAKGASPPGLNWPVCSEDGFLPPQASDADKDAVTTGWIPAFVERFTTPGELPRAVHTELLNLAEVKALKQEYTQASEPADVNVDFLSTNDLITAAVAEIWAVNQGAMAANMRNRIPEAGDSDMGNYERAVAFSSAKAANKPKYVRSVITKDFVCFEPGEVPDLSTCDFGIVTNWASLSKYIAPAGVEVVCHVPALPLDMFPMDVAVIFKANDNETAIIHNCTTAPSLDKMRTSTLYQRLTRPAVANLVARVEDSTAAASSTI